jgi:hypothetical protein
VILTTSLLRRFYNVFIQWVSDLNSQLSDIKRLDNAFTYCSDDGLRSSWIDHCICSNVVDQLISHIEVLCQYITSDHKPAMIVFSGICGTVCASSNSIVEKKTSSMTSQQLMRIACIRIKSP